VIHPARRWLTAALAVGLAASISLSEIVLLVLAVLAIVAALTSAERARWPLLWPIAVFSAWTIASAVLSGHPLESLVAAKTLIWLAVVWVVLRSLPDRASAYRFVAILFVATGVVAALSIVQVGVCPAIDEPTGLVRWFFHKCSRARGFFSIYMTLAGVLVVVLVMSLPLVARAARRRVTSVTTHEGSNAHDDLALSRWWLIAGWIVGVVALALTYVRGAWIGFAAGVIGCALAFRRSATVLIGVVLVTVVAVAVLPGVLDRALTLGHADDTVRDRLAMIHGGWAMVREHPITGVGVGEVKRLYPSYAPPEALRHSTSHLHNTPMQIFVERGAVGLVSWLAIYAMFFVEARRVLARIPPDGDRDRALVVGVMAAVAAFLIAGLFEYNFGDTEVILMVNALMALPFVIDRELTVERR